MSNKVLIGVVVVIIILIIILINYVANAFKNNGDRYQETPPGMITVEQKEEQVKSYANLVDDADRINSKYKASNYNEEYLSLTEEERYKIDDVIDNTLNLLSTKNINEIYPNHLSNDYILTRFPNKEELKKFLDENFDQEATYSVSSYEVSGATLLLPLFETKFGSRAEFGTIKIVDYLEPNFAIYFDNVQGIIRVTNTYRKDDFNILINYGLDYLDHCSFVFKVDNKTNKALDFDFENTYLNEKSGKVYNKLSLLGDSRISVPAGERAIYEAKFEKFNVSPDSFILNIKYGDKTIENDTLYINYNSEDEDF